MDFSCNFADICNNTRMNKTTNQIRIEACESQISFCRRRLLTVHWRNSQDKRADLIIKICRCQNSLRKLKNV